MPGKVKIMYLNLYKLTLSQLLFNGFDSKFKINLYNEHFPNTSEKYTRFSNFTLFFSISYVRVFSNILFFTTNTFISNARLKLAKNQANDKQLPEAEL